VSERPSNLPQRKRIRYKKRDDFSIALGQAERQRSDDLHNFFSAGKGKQPLDSPLGKSFHWGERKKSISKQVVEEKGVSRKKEKKKEEWIFYG